MTSEQILAMEAGRELDALVAEHVLGFTRYEGDEIPDEHRHLSKNDDQVVWLINPHQSNFRRYCKLCGDMPMFSEDISAAWEVVEKMREHGYDVALESLTDSLNAGGNLYHVRFLKRIEGDYAEYDSTISFEHAICLCALLAVMNL